MISLKFEVHKGEEDMKEDYKRFVRVQEDGSYASYEVPTKEEYNAAAAREARSFADLFRRVEALEEALECRTGKKTDMYKVSMCSVEHGGLELTGTEEQYKTFEKSREEIDKSLFPKFLTYDKLVRLALDCGLTVKKIEWK